MWKLEQRVDPFHPEEWELSFPFSQAAFSLPPARSWEGGWERRQRNTLHAGIVGKGRKGRLPERNGTLWFNHLTPRSGGSLCPEQVDNTASPFPWSPCQSTSDYASLGS